LRLFADSKRFTGVQQRGMARNFSWKSAAAAYGNLYHDAL
jgi:glycogen synthase